MATSIKEPSDDIKRLLKTLVDKCTDEDRSVRDRQVREWRRLKLLWETIQNVYYSEVAHDWRIPESERSGADSDQGYYDKPVNVYRAYLESIIAALSVTVPAITCYPDDADNPSDLATAKAGDKIAELVFKHNNVPLLWLHALFIFCTEGMTAMYAYPHEDESYGTYEQKKYEDQTDVHSIATCPNCGSEINDQVVPPPTPMVDPTTGQPLMDPNTGQPMMQPPQAVPQNPDEFMPGEPEYCPACGSLVTPITTEAPFTVTRMVGVTKHPKARICMEVFGGLFVKVPIWARNQKECSYLIYSYETHYANVLEKYPELKEKVNKGQSTYDMYEQWARTSPQYRGEQPENNVTVRNAWLRPCQYNILNEDEIKQLKKQYPDGVNVCVINDLVAHAENSALDDYWTITQNPLSDYVHFDPIGLLLTSVQEITNDLISLTVQTIEHGIPQTFADPKVLNFNSYRNSEVIPGGIYAATPKSGRALSEGFYEVKTATLSQEVLPFAQKVQEMGQLVSGALPSLFGGQMSGSRTASEYSMSRAQALQRLQTQWKMLTMWWKEVFGKVIPMYIKEVVEDEKQVKKDENGNFVNVFIRKAELEGKIGSVELEGNENLPITWNQQKDTFMELLQSQNPVVVDALQSPENLPYFKRVTGLTDYVIPNENDRRKQYEEIEQLINSEPIQVPPDPMMVQQAVMQGMPPPQPQMQPSVPVDPDLDNHEIEAYTCHYWLVGDAGRLCKTENPMGYQNVLLHYKMHKDVLMMQQMQQQQMQMQMQAQQQMMSGPPKQGGKPQSTGQEMGANENAQPTIQ